MKITEKEFRKLVREALVQEIKKSPLLKKAVKSMKKKMKKEDVDRVARHRDGHGDAFEEAADKKKDSKFLKMKRKKK